MGVKLSFLSSDRNATLSDLLIQKMVGGSSTTAPLSIRGK